MAWTEPEAWDVGDVLTKDRLNQEIRDNLLLLKSMPHAEYVGPTLFKGVSGSAWLDIDSTNLSLDLTVEWASAIVEIGLVASGGWNGSSYGVWTDVEVDGNRIGDATHGLSGTIDSNYYGNLGFTAIVTGLTQGLHTFKAQFKSGSGLIAVRQFWVRQVG